MAKENYDWKKAYTKNRTKIVRGLANPDEVADQLFRLHIFNEEMRDIIVQKSEIEHKSRGILDTLDKRGPKGVAALHQAFINTSNEKLAEILAPYVKAVEKRENKTEPIDWPPGENEEEEMLKEEIIKIKDPESPWFIHEYGKNYVYKMQGTLRGKVFVINNDKFGSKLMYRHGSNKDADNLTKLFEELHFTVQRWNNLEANEMISVLRNAAEQIKNENSIECVILIIMSHGGGARVYGVDCMPVELKALTDSFSSSNCPSLRGKPRLVFVQACRSVEIASIATTHHLVNPGEQVEIECNIKTDNPILEVFWVKDDSDVRITGKTNPDKYCLSSMTSTQSLTVKNVEDSDKGKYSCTVIYDTNYRTNLAELDLDINVASIEKTKHLVKPGGEVEIECIVNIDKPIKEVFWERDADSVKDIITEDSNSNKYCLENVKCMRRLTIKNVKGSDQGMYRCIVKFDEKSKNQSNPTELRLAIKDNSKASITKTIHLVKPGGQVEIACIISDKFENEIKEVRWEKDSKFEITEKTRPEKYSLEGTGKIRKLVVKDVENSDKGKYRCVVKYKDKCLSHPSELDLYRHNDTSDVQNDVKGQRDEMDSVPSQKENKVESTPKSFFPDHPLADFLIAYATPDGTQAWLNRDVGSWFMNAIVWTFKYHAHEEELHHLLIRVNRLVGKGSTFSNDMTVAEVKSNLRKKFYFFPGIHDDPPKLL